MASASLEPTAVGADTLVTPSVDEAPVSLALASTGADGAAGATESIVTDRTGDDADRFPAVSETFTVMEWTPSARWEAATEYDGVAVALPTCTPPSYSTTPTTPLGSVPVNV